MRVTVSKLYTEEEIQALAKPVPDIKSGGFKNYLGVTVNKLTIKYYLGKFASNKHSWAAECSCGSGFIVATSTSLCSIRSCGCYTLERIKEANKGNTAGSSNLKTEQTVEELYKIKPEYEVVNSQDGRVMSKWDFFCHECKEAFSARPDNILDRKSGGSQTPCNCCVRGGYSSYKEGTIYVITVDNYCKFGITNDFDKRYKQLSKSYGKTLNLEFILTTPYSGKLVAEIEKELKIKFDYRVDVGNIDGKTEYRLLSDKDSIIQEIVRVWAKDFKEK
jgi:hypothetical protein